MRKLLIILALAACQPTPPVVGASGVEVNAVETAANTYRVTAAGTATQSATNWEALEKAAALARANGFSHFRILSAQPPGAELISFIDASPNMGEMAGPGTVTMLDIELVNNGGPDTLSVARIEAGPA